MSLPPVVGTVFRLEKVCATHGTAVGMHAVIVAYTRNGSKDRMEVEVDVLGVDGESDAIKVSGDLKALAVDTNALSSAQMAAHLAIRAKAKNLKGLGHGSLSAIHSGWRALLQITTPPGGGGNGANADAMAAQAAARKQVDGGAAGSGSHGCLPQRRRSARLI